MAANNKLLGQFSLVGSFSKDFFLFFNRLKSSLGDVSIIHLNYRLAFRLPLAAYRRLRLHSTLMPMVLLMSPLETGELERSNKVSFL